MGRPHIEFIQSQALSWEPSPWQGLYADTEVKVLSQDAGSGATSNLIRYPAGWSRSEPEHLSVDEELYVLGGELTINGVNHGEACFAHLPTGFARASASASDGAVVLTFLSGIPESKAGAAPDGLYDEARLVTRIDALSEEFSTEFTVLGVQPEDVISDGLTAAAFLLLREDPHDREQTWILAARPFWQGGVEEIHPVVEEMYLVTGEMMADTGLMKPGAYFWRPPGKRHGPFGSKTGNTMFFRTKGGPLSTSFPDTGETFSWTPEHRPILPPEMKKFGTEPGVETLCY